MKLWIARNKNGNLHLFTTKPEIVADSYYLGFSDCIMNNDLFPEVTFENSPQEVELKLVSEIVGVAESPSKTFSRVNEFEVGASYRR